MLRGTHNITAFSNDLYGKFLRTTCNGLEFTARLILVNVPSFLLAKSPELDRICSITFTYLTLQVVGFCWAVLVNAAFALACRATAILPPILPQRDSLDDVSPQSPLSSPYTTLQLIAAFYVFYASIRVVINFAQNVFHLAMESIKDFPDATRVLSRGGVFTLNLAPIVFVPALFLEVCLIIADPLCGQHKWHDAQHVYSSAMKYESITHAVCYHSGLFYLTAEPSNIRRLVFYSLLTMVIQIWQILLHEFPRWDLAFKKLSFAVRVLFQLSLLFLSVLSIIILVAVTFLMQFNNTSPEATILCAALLGWTVWLFLFTPILVETHGEAWAKRTTPQSLQHIAAYARISHMIILAFMFFGDLTFFGALQAQLDLTFTTLAVPALYCCVYMLASTAIQAGPLLLARIIPLSLILSCVITLGIAQTGGKGGVILVFFHIFGKLVHFFAEEDDGGHGLHADVVGAEWMAEGEDDIDNDNSLDSLISVPMPLSGANPQLLQPLLLPVQAELSSQYGEREIPASVPDEKDTKLTMSPDGPISTSSQPPDASRTTPTAAVSSPAAGIGGGSAVCAVSSPSPSSSSGRLVSRVSVSMQPVVVADPSTNSTGSSSTTAGAGGRGVAAAPATASSPAHHQQSPSSRSVLVEMDITSTEDRRGPLTPIRPIPLPGLGFVIGNSPNSSNSLARKAASSGKNVLLAGTRSSGKFPATPSVSDGNLAAALDESSGSSSSISGMYKNRNNKSAQLLAERGQEHSSLVSLGLPESINKHWLVRTSRRNLIFIGNVWRTLAVPDSAISGVLRLFIATTVAVALMLSILSILSYAQQNLQIFPRLIDYHLLDDGTVHIDHRIVNVTFYPPNSVLHDLSSGAAYDSAWAVCENTTATTPTTTATTTTNLGKSYPRKQNCGGGNSSSKTYNPHHHHHHHNKFLPWGNKKSSTVPAPSTTGNGLIEPHYAVCGWKWNGLSLLDFAFLSEVAYFDDGEGTSLQELVDAVLPDAALTVNVTHAREALTAGSGPMFVELTSKKLGFTIVAVRGTDVARPYDFMEDIKMFAEPVIFTFLSSVFPTIRLWSQETTSKVIEWLYEFNSFFGLQGEAEYYRPLTQRIFEIIEDNDNKSNNDKNVDRDDKDKDRANSGNSINKSSPKREVMITGHSLGGGLARIVGTLTGLPSVSFSPPGLALSYRKYSATRKDGTVVRIPSNGAMHHNSVAVITEFDIVTQIDHQVGLVQTILCDKGDKAHQNSCHYLEGTMCHLLQHCGDDKNRFNRCEYEYNLAAVAPSVFSFVWAHRWIVMPIVLVATLTVALAIVPELL